MTFNCGKENKMLTDDTVLWCCLPFVYPLICGSVIERKDAESSTLLNGNQPFTLCSIHIFIQSFFFFTAHCHLVGNFRQPILEPIFYDIFAVNFEFLFSRGSSSLLYTWRNKNERVKNPIFGDLWAAMLVVTESLFYPLIAFSVSRLLSFDQWRSLGV